MWLLRGEHNPLGEKLGQRAWRNTKSVTVSQVAEEGLDEPGDW